MSNNYERIHLPHATENLVLRQNQTASLLRQVTIWDDLLVTMLDYLYTRLSSPVAVLVLKVRRDHQDRQEWQDRQDQVE